MSDYIPRDPNGFRHAQTLGYTDRDDPPNGNLCLECGAVVGSKALHDVFHLGKDEEDDQSA